MCGLINWMREMLKILYKIGMPEIDDSYAKLCYMRQFHTGSGFRQWYEKWIT